MGIICALYSTRVTSVHCSLGIARSWSRDYCVNGVGFKTRFMGADEAACFICMLSLPILLVGYIDRYLPVCSRRSNDLEI